MNPPKTKKKTAPPVSLAQNPEFLEFKTCVTAAKRILISTHSLPDGDGLGAESALFHYLRRSKKSCRVYNPDKLPHRYTILDPEEKILLGPGQVEIWDTFDLWIVVDTHDPRRLGPLWQELTLRAKKIYFIDHHPEIHSTEELNYPPHCRMLTDPASSSIGEMLTHLFKELELTKINIDIALGIYVSIMTDTNSFRYSRTTPESHRIAAEMLEHGVNAEAVYQAIFSSKELSHLKLLGSLLQSVDTDARGQIAWMHMDLDLRKKYRASADDTQSFLNFLLLLKDSEVVCLFREEDAGEIRVSMRSKGKIVINRIAAEFGGGGHDFAAGFAVNAPLQKTIKSVIARVASEVDAYQRFGNKRHE